MRQHPKTASWDCVHPKLAHHWVMSIISESFYASTTWYGVAMIKRLLIIIGRFAKEPYKRDDILQNRPIISRSLLIVVSPYLSESWHTWMRHATRINETRYILISQHCITKICPSGMITLNTSQCELSWELFGDRCTTVWYLNLGKIQILVCCSAQGLCVVSLLTCCIQFFGDRCTVYTNDRRLSP